MSSNNTVVVSGHELTKVTIGEDSVYAGLSFYTKKAIKLEDACKQAGTNAVLAGFNSSLNSALSAKARAAVFEGQEQRPGEAPAAYTKRCVDAFKASGKTELLSQEEAEAFVYGARTLTLSGVAGKLTAARKALAAEKAKGTDANPVELTSLAAQIQRYSEQLTQMASEAGADLG